MIRERLLTTNPKIEKSNAQGEFLTAIMHLAPATLSGYQTCPNASPGCRACCLNLAGQGGIGVMYRNGGLTNLNHVQRARIRRTRLFFERRAEFLERLERDIALHVRAAERRGVAPVVRLNGTSDIPFETLAPQLFEKFPQAQFYDYSKSYKRMFRMLKGYLPANYHLTFSLSETNWPDAQRVLNLGGNVAAVIQTCEHVGWHNCKCENSKPSHLWGFPVIDGDQHDLTFLHGTQGAILALEAKGPARRDHSGFVARTYNQNPLAVVA